MAEREVVVVGAGPAGIAAAVQMKRCGIEPLVYEKGAAGGLLRNANLVENYPGFPDGVTGPDLVALFRTQLETCGVQLREEEVSQLDYRAGAFTVVSATGEVRCRRVVVASGTRPKQDAAIRVHGGARGRVLYEVHPVRGVSGKRIAIVGAGDAAFDYALSLSGRNDVVVLNRGERLRCIPVLWQRCMAAGTVAYRPNISVREIAMHGERLLVRCTRAADGSGEEMTVDYVLLAIGREPELGFIAPAVSAALERFVDEGALFLIGDARNATYRQTAICVGDGVRAALAMYEVTGRGRHEGSRENG